MSTRLMSRQLPYYIGRVYVDDRPAQIPPATAQLTRKNEVPMEVLLHSSLPADTRVIHPYSSVRMDYQRHRLNIHLDKEGRVVAQSMG